MTTPRRPEQVVLLDTARLPIGTALKSEVHTADTPLHLAFSCWVLDDDGRVLLTRRALSKRTWPGVWTNSFCGHPGPGEPFARAIERRAREELGCEVEVTRWLDGAAPIGETHELRAALEAYPQAEVVWVQDEPANQGPWPFMALNLVPQLDREVTLVSRPALAATSAGTKGRHDEEAEVLQKALFGL